MKKIILILCLVWFQSAHALDVFGKGSVSQNYLDVDKYTISVSLSGGIAMALLPFVRLEARYSNTTALQNKMDVVSGSILGTLTNINTETRIVSVGLDIDLFSERSSFQPFIYAGLGYLETERSSYFTLAGSSSTTFYKEPTKTGLSVNGGLGIRLRLAKQIALELEAFGYVTDIHDPQPLLNLYGTAGLRIGI